MFRKTGRVLILSLALAATAAPVAFARPRVESPPRLAEVHDAFERLWAVLRGLVDSRSGPYQPGVAADCERGSIMDPNGCPQAQRGSIMDPDG